MAYRPGLQHAGFFGSSTERRPKASRQYRKGRAGVALRERGCRALSFQETLPALVVFRLDGPLNRDFFATKEERFTLFQRVHFRLFLRVGGGELLAFFALEDAAPALNDQNGVPFPSMRAY